MSSLSDDEKKVLKCFITPRWPQAVRTPKAVSKETGLDIEVVLGFLSAHEMFSPIDEKWQLDLELCLRTYYASCPEVFDNYYVVKKDGRPFVLLDKKLGKTAELAFKAFEASQRGQLSDASDEFSFAV